MVPDTNTLSTSTGSLEQPILPHNQAQMNGRDVSNNTFPSVGKTIRTLRSAVLAKIYNIFTCGKRAVNAPCLTLKQILQEAGGDVKKINPECLKALQSRQSEIAFVFPSEYFSDANLNAFLEAFPRATKLSFSHCEDMTPEQLERIVHHYPDLQSLDLSGCWRLADAITTIARSCPKLQSLSLSGLKRITDAAIQALAKGCRNLQSLDLTECDHLTDAAIQAIAPGCQKLQSLSLSGCYNLTDAAITAITQSCPDLQSLNLSGCDQLTNDAIQAIAQSFPKLQSLSLSGCYNLTDAAITAIARGRLNLQYLNLHRCKHLSPDKIAKLRERYPSLDIDLPQVKNFHLNHLFKSLFV